MSSTNRGGERIEGDFYPTPRPLADLIVRHCTVPCVDVLEPSAGTGVFVDAVRECYGIEADAIEPNEYLYPGPNVLRMTLEEAAKLKPTYDLIIGNPPYSLAEAHIRLCLGMLNPRGRLVFLLRLALLESKKRVQFWRDHPASQVLVLPERPSFCASWKCKTCGTRKTTHPDGVWSCCGPVSVTRSDSTAYAVFVWENGYPGPAELGFLIDNPE